MARLRAELAAVQAARAAVQAQLEQASTARRRSKNAAPAAAADLDKLAEDGGQVGKCE
jgi:hypothetical protein